MATDKPKSNFSFSALDREADGPEPFIYTTKSSKRVTFPDIFDMEADEGEKFLSDMRSATDGEVIRQWLTKDDQAKLSEDKLTVRQRMTLVRRVMAYYEASFGTPGEEDASDD